MDSHHRTALRAAARVREQLLQRRRIQGDTFLPAHALARADARLRQRDRARNLGWLRAAASLADDLVFDLNCLNSQIEHAIDVLRKHAHLQPIASQAEVYRDIMALDQEFEEVEVDLKQGRLSVVTDEIVLDEIELGAFEIRLHVDHLGETPCYRIIAQDPNPAACDSSVTHPHVQDCHLCEGDGHQAIQTALTEGRAGLLSDGVAAAGHLQRRPGLCGVGSLVGLLLFRLWRQRPRKPRRIVLQLRRLALRRLPQRLS